MTLFFPDLNVWLARWTLTLHQAWEAYERWFSDPRVEFYPELRGLDMAFRKTTTPLTAQKASKLVGDCSLLAYAQEIDARLVTFDKGLLEIAKKHGYPAFSPA